MAKSMKDVRRKSKVTNQVIDKGEVAPIDSVEDVKEMVKRDVVDKSGGLAKTDNLNPEFEGFEFVKPNTIQKDMNIFKIYTATTGEEAEANEIVGVLLSGKPAYSLWDKGNKKFYISYDRQTAVTGEDWEELKAISGASDNFRYHVAVLIPDMSEEPYSFLMSGTGFYNLKAYKDELEQQGIKLANAVTKIKLKSYKSDFGGYFAEVFEFVDVFKE